MNTDSTGTAPRLASAHHHPPPQPLLFSSTVAPYPTGNRSSSLAYSKQRPTTLSDNTFSKAIDSFCAPTAVPRTMTDPSAGLSRRQPHSCGNAVTSLLGGSQTRFARRARANYRCWCLPRPMSPNTGSRILPSRSFLLNRHLGFASPPTTKVLSNA